MSPGSSPCMHVGGCASLHTTVCMEYPARKSVQGTPRTYVLTGVSVYPSHQVHVPARNQVQGSSPEHPARTSSRGVSVNPSPHAHSATHNCVQGIPRVYLPTHISLHAFHAGNTPRARPRGGFCGPKSPRALPYMHCRYTEYPVHTSPYTSPCTDFRAGNTPRARPRGGFREPKSRCAHPCTHCGYTAAPRTW
ncbi:hypothetical protein B0H13DRAFT_2339979 [Mycena leptocephala]|nr:hypothetical protein B0H13DRAFT_2339979 [Mycena leptocephala]